MRSEKPISDVIRGLVRSNEQLSCGKSPRPVSNSAAQSAYSLSRFIDADHGHGHGHGLRRRSAKKRTISALAAGPSGSVYEQPAVPPNHAWPAPCTIHCSKSTSPASE